MANQPDKQKPELKANLKATFRDDVILVDQLLRMVLLAIEIADKSPEEAEATQNKFIDR